MTGFGIWKTLGALEQTIQEAADAHEGMTGTRPAELVVGADVAVALHRFGFTPTDEVRRVLGRPHALLGTVAGVELLTPLQPERGCG